MINKDLSWVILAGGKATRMGGTDKGLLQLQGQLLIEIIFNKLHQQINNIRINANRNQHLYQKYAPVFEDKIPGYFGPLAGIHAALISSKTDWVGFTPCDSPNLNSELIPRLSHFLDDSKDIYVASDGQFPQPVFSIWHKQALPKLEAFLKAGDRKMKLLLEQCHTEYVDFSDMPEIFINLNTPEQLTNFGAKNDNT